MCVFNGGGRWSIKGNKWKAVFFSERLEPTGRRPVRFEPAITGKEQTATSEKTTPETRPCL